LFSSNHTGFWRYTQISHTSIPETSSFLITPVPLKRFAGKNLFPVAAPNQKDKVLMLKLVVGTLGGYLPLPISSTTFDIAMS
jgi:hypothetical protein